MPLNLFTGPLEWVCEVLNNQVIDILNAGATMSSKRFDLMECINLMESGEENIYIVDEEGRFAWRVLQGKGFCLKCEQEGKVRLQFSTLAPVTFNLALNDENKEEMLKST